MEKRTQTADLTQNIDSDTKEAEINPVPLKEEVEVSPKLSNVGATTWTINSEAKIVEITPEPVKEEEKVAFEEKIKG